MASQVSKVCSGQEHRFRCKVRALIGAEVKISVPDVARRFEVNRYDRIVDCGTADLAKQYLAILIASYTKEGWEKCSKSHIENCRLSKTIRDGITYSIFSISDEKLYWSAHHYPK